MYMAKSKIDFRSDINGLRAWAVMSVILYHFGVPGFNGGYVGVDIFFVISGFLMTGIIIKKLESPGVTSFALLKSFYLARARRIWPALIVLCGVLLIVGWFFIPSIDYRVLGSHVVSALAFYSNVQFRNESGYFDTTSHEKLLLHTWSLSVEWQFYVLLPLALLILWKAKPDRRFIFYCLLCGFVASFFLSVFYTIIKPTAAFYLLPTRAWEMLAGGIVFLFPQKAKFLLLPKSVLSFLGMGILIFSIAIFDTASAWPSWRALVPVIGTSLVLHANLQQSVLIRARLLQWVGTASYSLYLWHWPVVVALLYFGWSEQPSAIAAGILATFLLGHASYQLIEKRFTARLSKLSTKSNMFVLAGAIFAVLVPGFVVKMLAGIPTRLDSRIEAAFSASADRNPRMAECHVMGSKTVPECTYGGRTLGVIVMGDSHAASIVRAVEAALPSKELHVLDWTMNGCRTLLNSKKLNDPEYQCGDFAKWALEKQKRLPKDVPLIIMARSSFDPFGGNEHGKLHPERPPEIYFTKPYSSRTPEYLKEVREELIDAACEFNKTRPVYLVRPTPELKLDVPRTTGRAMMMHRNPEVALSMREYWERHRLIWDAQDEAVKRCGVKVLNPLPYLCKQNACYGVENDVVLYYDDDHLSEKGASRLVPMFSSVFRQ